MVRTCLAACLLLLLLPASVCTSETCFEHNIDYTDANNLDTDAVAPTPDASACQHLCASRKECHFWTHKHGHCHLKGALLKTAPNPFWAMAPHFPTYPTPNVGSVSGPKACRVHAVHTKSAFIEEMLGLETCTFDGLPAIRSVVQRCAKGSDFAHWQVGHAQAAAPSTSTYPKRTQWVHCARPPRRCMCYTRVRYGSADSWVYHTVTPTATSSKGVPCVAKSFASGLDLGSTPHCECEVPEGERRRSAEATYLSITMGTTRPRGACDVPLAHFSPQLDSLSLGWGEAAAHIAIGLTSHCFKELPEWVSVASWKQDKKNYQLPCASLTKHPLQGKAALVYTQHITHWRSMPMNISGDVRAVVKEVFNVELPEVLVGGSGGGGGGGNPFVEGWGERGWSHPCCMYAVLSRDAHRSFAKLFLLVTSYLSHVSSPSADAAYCMLWKQRGCVARWYGYLAEMLFITFLYATQDLFATHPAATPTQCSNTQPTRHALHGILSTEDIERAYDELFP